jgi:hypothetical protein
VIARHFGARPEHVHAGGVPNRFEAEHLQHRREQGGVLEAIAAAPGLDQFGLQALQIEPHPAS